MKEYELEDVLELLYILNSKLKVDMAAAVVGRDSQRIHQILLVQSYIDELIDKTQDDIIDRRLADPDEEWYDEIETDDWGF